VQKINLSSLNSGDTFVIEFDFPSGSPQTVNVTVGDDYAQTRDNIEAALNTLSLGAGGSAQVINNGDGTFNITFSGGNVGGVDLPLMSITPSTGTPFSAIHIKDGSTSNLTYYHF
jgi:hypothetical protein